MAYLDPSKRDSANDSSGIALVTERTERMVSKGWIQGVALVMIFGFFIMGLLALRTYTDSMPLPQRVVDERGEVVFTQAEVTSGQQIFLRRGLQQYGSVMGHGGYLGPDYTADYLRRSATIALESLQNSGSGDASADLVQLLRTNRYDEESGDLVYTPQQVEAFERLQQHYGTFFGEDSTKNGLVPNAISDPEDIHDLTAFFSWTAWAAAAERPGHDYSYTNNWPPEKLVDNGPTADAVVWSGLSLVALLAGTGALLAVYGRWSQKIGWHNAEAPALSFKQPGEVQVTPAQRATAWFFFVIALLFLGQALLGAAVEHYRADLTSFFGIDLAQLLPFNLARTWHVQLSLFWTAASFLGAGIFLAPYISGREPKNQHWLAFGLLGAVALVVVGSMTGEALSIHGVEWAEGSPLWDQQWEYLDLPRVWQALLTIGMFLWIAIIYRAIRSRLKTEHRANMPWLFFYAGLAIPGFR